MRQKYEFKNQQGLSKFDAAHCVTKTSLDLFSSFTT